MTLTSRITAVNMMLRGAGYRPTATLDGSLPREVDMADQVLSEVTIEVLAKGWKFNTEKEVKYTPSTINGTIAIDDDIMSIDGSANRSENIGIDIVQRGLNLYDAKGLTLVFSKDVYCDQIINLSWDLIPEPFKAYIKIRSSRRFSDVMNADHPTHIYKKEDESRALRIAQQLDNRNKDTIIQNLPAIDYRTSVLGRGRIRH